MLDDIAISLRRIADALERIEEFLQAIASPVEHTGTEADLETEASSVDWVSDDFEELPSVFDSSLPQSSYHGSQDAIQEAISWFESLNCAVLDYKVVSPEKELWDWVAMFLGQRFENLQEFYEKWKVSTNNRTRFEVFLNGAESIKISDNVQFAHKLRDLSLISNYYYNKGMRKLIIDPLFTPEVINFVTGYWLEYYISRLIWNTKINNGSNIKNFALLRNIQIILPNNQNKEIDLFIIKNSCKIWIECTSSEYQRSINNWREISDYLHLPLEHKIAVALKSPNDIVTRSSFQRVAQMTLLDLDELPNTLSRLLN